MTGSRSKGAIALGVVLAVLLLVDLYKAEFGAPQHQPIPVSTVGVAPEAPTSTGFTQTTPGVQTNQPAATTPSVP